MSSSPYSSSPRTSGLDQGSNTVASRLRRKSPTRLRQPNFFSSARDATKSIGPERYTRAPRRWFWLAMTALTLGARPRVDKSRTPRKRRLPPRRIFALLGLLPAVHDQPTYTVYFGGELFSTKHLLGNAVLAGTIRQRSGGRFQPLLPQTLEQRDTTAHAIRDQDIRALLACDLGIFQYDGPELDSGTVVEFMFAKFADIPAVLLRTDFRGSGELSLSGEPWNLMTSFYPRTVSVVLDAMSIYHRHLDRPPGPLFAGVAPDAGEHASVAAAQKMIDQTADAVIAALERLLTMPPVLSTALREPVYTWLATMPGFKNAPDEVAPELLARCAQKQTRGLL